MAKTRGTGLLMVWTDIDAEFEPEFNRRYDEEHLPRLLQIPGFLSAGRYSALIYELEDHNVLRSSAYLDSLKYQPSAVRQKTGTSRIGRNFRAMLTGRSFRCTPIQSSRRPAWRRSCRWGGSTFRARSRRNSTLGTTRSTSPVIWRCRAVWARAAMSPSRAGPNT
jgi:hypothetical protein